MVELTFVYEGTDTGVSIAMYDKDDDQSICTFDGVNQDDEITCKAATSGLDKLPKSTTFVITQTDGTICSATYHTSCSVDVVGVVLEQCEDLVAIGYVDSEGTICTESSSGEYPPLVGSNGDGCGDYIAISGWRDVNNLSDGQECDDGWEVCPYDPDCNGTTPNPTTPAPNTPSPTTPSPTTPS
eukprot:338032_1